MLGDDHGTHGGLDVLEVQERPEPSPGPGQVRIDVRAAGVNFADTLARVGLYADAREGVGEVHAGRAHVDAYLARSRGRLWTLLHLQDVEAAVRAVVIAKHGGEP